MATHSQAVDSGPVRDPACIVSLDLIREVAVLGILPMNAVSFGVAVFALPVASALLAQYIADTTSASLSGL